MCTHMKQVTIRELRSSISTLLKELPFEVIDGKTKNVLAMVVLPTGEVAGEKPVKAKVPVKSDKKFLPVGTQCKHNLIWHEGCHF